MTVNEKEKFLYEELEKTIDAIGMEHDLEFYQIIDVLEDLAALYLLEEEEYNGSSRKRTNVSGSNRKSN